MKIDMHVHSLYSPIIYGRFFPLETFHSPKKMIRMAKKIGLDGIALTDHDSIKGVKEAKKEAKKIGMILIPGCEITTKDGHLLAYWLNKVPKPYQPVEETIDELRSQGSLIAAPHPYHIGFKFSLKEKAFKLKIDAIEVYNARSCKLFDIINLKKGKKTGLPLIAGSDAHSSWELGGAFTEFPEIPAKSLKKAVPIYKYSTPLIEIGKTYYYRFLWKFNKKLVPFE